MIFLKNFITTAKYIRWKRGEWSRKVQKNPGAASSSKLVSNNLLNHRYLNRNPSWFRWKRLRELSGSQRFRGDSVVASILDKLSDIKLIPMTFVVDLWLVDWQSGFASVLSRSLEPSKAFFGDGRVRWNDPTCASTYAITSFVLVGRADTLSCRILEILRYFRSLNVRVFPWISRTVIFLKKISRILFSERFSS